MSPWTVAAGASAAAWLYLLLLRGAFWRVRPFLEVEDTGRVGSDTARSAGPSGPGAPTAVWPPVAAVVPARDEADTIGRVVASLVAQDYPGPFSVVVVDDASEDGTGEAARSAGDARVRVIRSSGPPPGWTGKVAAMRAGFSEALRSGPAWIWFTDADVEHDPGVLRALVTRAERDRLDLASTMVLLHAGGLWEGLLIPAFVYFFRKLYPFSRVGARGRRSAAAAGGSMLVRASALEAAGGLERIRDRIIDDCALARLLSERGAIWLGLTRASRSLRGYGFGGVWRMVSRTAFTQLGRSWTLLALTAAGMVLLYGVPVAGAIRGAARGDGTLVATAAGAWLVMAATFVPTLRLYGRPAASALLLPLAGLLYTAMTVDSAIRYAAGSGGGWKGRHQAHVAGGRTPPA